MTSVHNGGYTHSSLVTKDSIKPEVVLFLERSFCVYKRTASTQNSKLMHKINDHAKVKGVVTYNGADEPQDCRGGRWRGWKILFPDFLDHKRVPRRLRTHGV